MVVSSAGRRCPDGNCDQRVPCCGNGNCRERRQPLLVGSRAGLNLREPAPNPRARKQRATVVLPGKQRTGRWFALAGPCANERAPTFLWRIAARWAELPGRRSAARLAAQQLALDRNQRLGSGGVPGMQSAKAPVHAPEAPLKFSLASKTHNVFLAAPKLLALRQGSADPRPTAACCLSLALGALSPIANAMLFVLPLCSPRDAGRRAHFANAAVAVQLPPTQAAWSATQQTRCTWPGYTRGQLAVQKQFAGGKRRSRDDQIASAAIFGSGHRRAVKPVPTCRLLRRPGTPSNAAAARRRYIRLGRLGGSFRHWSLGMTLPQPWKPALGLAGILCAVAVAAGTGCVVFGTEGNCVNPKRFTSSSVPAVYGGSCVAGAALLVSGDSCTQTCPEGLTRQFGQAEALTCSSGETSALPLQCNQGTLLSRGDPAGVRPRTRPLGAGARAS